MTYRVVTASDLTRKLVYDEGYIAVIIPTINGKHTVCVSCQIGCPIGCSFCRTGAFVRNLSADEIVAQFTDATSVIGTKPTAVVYMGMGEPMRNFVAVRASIDTLNKKFGLSYKSITLSTSCLFLEKLLDSPFHVALSLHSPFDAVRKSLIPGAMPVKKIVDFAHAYGETHKDGVMIEYALMAGINDRDEDIIELLSLAWPKNTNFNLIEFNSTNGFVRSDRALLFKERIRAAGFKCFIRHSRGSDIEAACGMLETL